MALLTCRTAIVHHKDKRTATLNMTDHALDLIVERLRMNGEPPEWKGKDPPNFITEPNSPEAHRKNFQRYITGYPRIVIAADRGG